MTPMYFTYLVGKHFTFESNFIHGCLLIVNRHIHIQSCKFYKRGNEK